MRVGRRFSIKMLLAVTTLCGVVLAAWRMNVEPYRQQLAAAAMVERLNGSTIAVPQQEPAWQKWLVETALGADAFVRVTDLKLRGVELTERDAALLAGLTWVEGVDLSRTAVSGSGVSALGPLRRVRSLNLSRSGVTDADLLALGAKPVLKDLRLTGCEVSGESADVFASWKALRLLMVRWTLLDQAAVDGLAARLPDCEIVFQPRGPG